MGRKRQIGRWGRYFIQRAWDEYRTKKRLEHYRNLWEERTMYAVEDFGTKKALKAAVAEGPISCYQPGPFGPDVSDGEHTCEGPHYPKPHKWYARVEVRSGKIVRVIG